METGSLIQALVALVFVLGLIGLTSVGLRYFGGDRLLRVRRKKGQERRLQIVESLILDARRRLVIVRRDNVEHVLLLGADRETLIETHTAHAPSRKKKA